jgi:excinuclease ABC subunit A
MRGFSPARFSFNSAEGRCPECKGAGKVKLEMNFLPPAFMKCEVCQGNRFSPEVLDILYNGKNIAEVLDLSVNESVVFFRAIPKIHRALNALCETGLGYLKLGQSSPTLSGGEAQRVKLVTHLLSGLSDSARLRAEAKKNLFILEEPTIGLHMSDVRRLVGVIQSLVNYGHTVLVIEHNLDLIAAADWVIDLGPEGGNDGGNIIAQGSPKQISKVKRSHTGRYLKRFFL